MTQLALQMILSRPGGPGSPAVIDSAKLHDVVVRRGVGALLNVAYVAMSPEEWRAANDMIARFAAPLAPQGPRGVRHRRRARPALSDHEHDLPAEHRDGGDVQPRARAPLQRDHGVRDAGERHRVELLSVLDVGRHPAWPRFYETFGEDPYVASVMGDANRCSATSATRHQRAARHERGAPGVGGRVFVAASAKHFLGYFDAAQRQGPHDGVDPRARAARKLPAAVSRRDPGRDQHRHGELGGHQRHARCTADRRILIDLLRTESAHRRRRRATGKTSSGCTACTASRRTTRTRCARR